MQKEYLNNILALYAELRCQDRGRSVRSHAPGVRSCVPVIDSLMVLVFRQFNNEKNDAVNWKILYKILLQGPRPLSCDHSSEVFVII